VVEEVLSSIRVVKAFAREEFEVHRLEKRAWRRSRSPYERAA
jgi:ABC-type multidrug transport system fused ATPase/permease subunit